MFNVINSKLAGRLHAIFVIFVCSAPLLGQSSITADPATPNPALGIAVPAPPTYANAGWDVGCPEVNRKPYQVGPPFVPAAGPLTCTEYELRLREDDDGVATVWLQRYIQRTVFVPQLNGYYWSLPEGDGLWIGSSRLASTRQIRLDLPVRSVDGHGQRRLVVNFDASEPPRIEPSGYVHDVWVWGLCLTPELADYWGDICPIAASTPAQGFFVLRTGHSQSWTATVAGSLDGEPFGPHYFAEVGTSTGEFVCGAKGELFWQFCATRNWVGDYEWLEGEWRSKQMPTQPGFEECPAEAPWWAPFNPETGRCEAGFTGKWDADGDGHASLESGGDDFCDLGNEGIPGCTPENAPTMYPGAPEICGDGIDQNGDGTDLIC